MTEIDTDVNAAALAEFKMGKHGIKQSLVYITIGTGVGVGVIAGGRTVHGLTHPEGGHIMYYNFYSAYRSLLNSTLISKEYVPITKDRLALKEWCVINRLQNAFKYPSLHLLTFLMTPRCGE